MLPSSKGRAALRMLQAEAKRRGVAFRFPEFDADDQSQVSLGDIWGMFPEPVLAAMSQRFEDQEFDGAPEHVRVAGRGRRSHRQSL